MMEPDTEHWSWSIFRTWQLALVFLLPSTLFFAASIATAVRLHSRGMLFTGSRWLPQAIDVRRLLADGLYVDTQRVRTAKEMIAAHRATPARIASNFLARSRPLGPHTAITEADVRAAYSPHATLPDGEELLADGVVLLLRLACLLVASGQATVEIELLLASICQRLSLRGAVVQVGHREVRAQFGGGEPVFYASCGMDFKLSRMSDVQMLARRVALVKPPLRACLAALDEIEDRPPPYGWAVRLIAMELVCTLAPLSVYGGDYVDMLGGALLGPCVMLTLALLWALRQSHLELLMVSFTVGVVTPVVWKLVLHPMGAEQCSTAPAAFGTLLIWLPGLQLVYGVHEIRLGSVVDGFAPHGMPTVRA